MKALYERWAAISLPKRILGGMILGAVLGMVIPQAVGISILGNLFVNALKGIAPLLVFFLDDALHCGSGNVVGHGA